MASVILGGLDLSVLLAVALILVLVNAEAGHEYEVFLSFRGPDSRLEFTDNLYHRLKDAGVQTFRDDEELRVGEEIGPELMRAIKQSKISIPIFSKGYALSKWCLKEVAEMVKHKDETKHMILPIFLDVTTDEVQHQTGSYAEAFAQHEEKYNFKTVQEWRDALQKVVKLKGLELKKEANGRHGEFIKKVLARVLISLKKAYLDVNDILIGIDHHVEAIKTTLLEVDETGVQIVGIWGMGGIGKTTLAKVVYNQLLDQFESSCFLNDIRETSSQHKGLEYLQSKLVADILNCERKDFANTDEGTKQLKYRLRHKKAIILLDDVDGVDQLKALAGDLAWFGPGSRIIITTREKKVLDLFQVSDIYELTLLSADQAFELFCRHAFIKGLPTPDLYGLSWDIVRTTGSLPLALEVIGSSLSTSSGRKEIWQGTLKQLKKKPHMKVQDTLRISYDGLDRKQQEIFLDISCFFIGTDARTVKPMWDDRDFFPEVEIEILLLKSLIRITDDSKLWMHDQLRDLGREIVEQENYKEPWLRSRLWHSEVAMRVLERQPWEGKTKVEAISLEGYQFRLEDHCIEDDQFMHLTNLRILQLEKASLCGNFERLLPDLQWLSWRFCNSNPTPPTNLDLKNLIVLDLSRSMVSEDWAGWSLMKVARKLKVLDLTGCLQLRKTPDFSAFPALERLILRSCHNLISIDPSIEKLSALVSLDIRNCTTLKDLPQLGSMEALTELLVDGTSIRELPVLRDTDKLENLETLSANNCKLLAQIPDSLKCLKKLKLLSLDNCQSLGAVPDSIGQLTSLVELSLSGTQIRRLPDSVGNLTLLTVLKIDHSRMTCLPSTLSTLENLQVLNASGCVDLEGEIPINIGSKSSMRILQLADTKISSLPTSISCLRQLEILDLGGCQWLEALPNLPSSLISLRLGGESIRIFPNLKHLINLKELICSGCHQLVEVPPGIRNLSKLEKLELSNTGITTLPEQVGALPRLRELRIRKCLKLKCLPRLPPSLYELEISFCSSLARLPNLSNLNKLSVLRVYSSCKITEIPGLQGLTSLKRLDTSLCPITHLDGLERLYFVSSLHVQWSQMVKLPNLPRLRRLSEMTASYRRKHGPKVA
ncbi:TMV resistance protein N-like isoform X1 [Punica granatum]|uniref:TMV resistance protein N-like isoform X1 n=2 Tax=Punica granatum TaxID=22663 RepID=A0A6P8C8P6_PUNGR|nr:TMV resistance protein N-like isoform X1 [Punica granatum]